MASLDVSPELTARRPSLPGMRFAVVDVETSGLDVQRHHILQVAVVLIDADGTVLDTYSSLVRPRYGMYSRVGPRHIHGISRWSLRRAPRPEQVLPHITRLIEGAVVTGHNVAFDVAFLERAAQRAGVPLAIERTLCTLGLSRWLDPDRQRRHRLTDLCDRYGITHARPHDALADALATAQVLPRLLAHVAADAPAALAGLLPPGDTLQP